MRRLQSSVISLALVSVLILCSCKQNASEDIPLDVEEEQEVNSFSNLILAVTTADSLDQYALVESFLDSSQAPFIESDTIAYFLYVGDASSVQVAGDFTNWNPSGRNFERLRDTNLWFRKEIFEDNARLDYKLVINNSNWILDPMNPNRISGGFGPNSELAMLQYVQPTEIVAREETSKGTISVVQVGSTNTGRTYDVHVYLPASYDASNTYPAVYFQDGADYLNLASSATVIDNLIHDELIRPLIGVFVVPNDRNIEYALEDRFKYADFFVEELVPFIDANYSTIDNPAERAVMGDSYGGNISAIIAFQNPDVFGNCGIHSGAFQNYSFHTNNIVMDDVKKPIRVASIWGTYEGSSLPPNMRRVKDYLVEMEYDIAWKELPEGHSWGLWRATTDDMLTFFFPQNQ